MARIIVVLNYNFFIIINYLIKNFINIFISFINIFIINDSGTDKYCLSRCHCCFKYGPVYFFQSLGRNP